MYEKNLLKVVVPPCETTDEDGYCDESWEEGHLHRIRDNRDGCDVLLAGTVYLPHSCDQWVIGGKAEVEIMIQDLQEILKTL